MTARPGYAIGLVCFLVLTAGCLFGGTAGQQPNPQHALAVDNDWNRSVEVSLAVVRQATNETVHTGTYRVAAGADREIYDTAVADPDGIETFEFVVTARNTTESVSITTDQCHGDAILFVSAEGAVSSTYAIC